MFAFMATRKPQTRAYLRGIPGLHIEVQRDMARTAKCDVLYEAGEDGAGTMGVRGRWLASLQSGDTAWLPSLLCLVLPPKERADDYRPTSDLCATIVRIMATGAIVFDVRAKLTSEKPVEWANHVLRMSERASQGERPEHVRRRAAKRASAKRLPGIKLRWEQPEMAERLERQRVIWTGAGTLERVTKHLDAELRGLSSRTLYDILGPRRPDDPGAGGRGKTRGSK